jgi:RHS repeat-associated protein
VGAGLGTFAYNLRFSGQYYDAETGLNQNYFRDYDPAVGRYAESDPIGLSGGVNTYAYALSMPTMDIDPRGHQAIFPGYGDPQERSNQIDTVGAWYAWIAQRDAAQALQEARNSGLPGLHNGPADAFRHCTWSCLMTKDIGAENAMLVGNVHELNDTRRNQPTNELRMDLANNAVGRECGLVKNKKSCTQRCMDKYTSGLLFGLDAVPMPVAP